MEPINAIYVDPIVVAWIVQQIPQSMPHSILSIETPINIGVFSCVFHCVLSRVLSRVSLARLAYMAYDTTCYLDETNTLGD